MTAVFPARAGMSRVNLENVVSVESVPRASGDEPAGVRGMVVADECSPRERG